MLQNENEYHQDNYGEAAVDLQDAIRALWIAGASVQNVVEELDLALAGIPRIREHIKVGLRT